MIKLNNYRKQCKTAQGAIKRFYLLPYVQYPSVLIQTDGMKLTDFPKSNIFIFECLGSYNQDSQIENGAWFISQSVQVQIPKVYDNFDIQNYLKQDYSVIVETNNGDNIIFGVYNGMDGSITNGSGSDKAEFNGFNLDFSGREETTGLLIENLSDFFNILQSNILNATLNFNI